VNIESTIESSTYGKLAVGDLFIVGIKNGQLLVGMKVETQGDASPNRSILEFRDDAAAPVMMSERFNGSSDIVGKLKNFAIVVQPGKGDFLFDPADARRQTPGCIHISDDNVFLVTEMHETLYSVNLKTGKGIQGTRRDVIGVPRWQLVETVGDKKNVWVDFEVPNQRLVKKGAA